MQVKYACPPGEWTKLTALDAAASGSTQANAGGGRPDRPVILYIFDAVGAALDDDDIPRAIIGTDRQIIPWTLNGVDTIWARPYSATESVDVIVVN